MAIISRSRRMTIPNAVVTPTENRLEVPKKEKGTLVYSALQMDGMERVMMTRSSEIKVKERVKGVEGGEGESDLLTVIYSYWKRRQL